MHSGVEYLCLQVLGTLVAWYIMDFHWCEVQFSAEVFRQEYTKSVAKKGQEKEGDSGYFNLNKCPPYAPAFVYYV